MDALSVFLLVQNMLIQHIQFLEAPSVFKKLKVKINNNVCSIIEYIKLRNVKVVIVDQEILICVRKIILSSIHLKSKEFHLFLGYYLSITFKLCYFIVNLYVKIELYRILFDSF